MKQYWNIQASRKQKKYKMFFTSIKQKPFQNNLWTRDKASANIMI